MKVNKLSFIMLVMENFMVSFKKFLKRNAIKFTL